MEKIYLVTIITHDWKAFYVDACGTIENIRKDIVDKMASSGITIKLMTFKVIGAKAS